MNGLMVSLIIVILAGTAIGQQADDAANSVPELRQKTGANSLSMNNALRPLEKPGPDDSTDDSWETPTSVLGDQSTTTSLSKRPSNQSTSFGARSERLSGSSPAADQQLPRGIRFDVMLRPEDLASVKRGGTLGALVDIQDRLGSQLDPSVVSDIAFFHQANAGDKTRLEYIEPEDIEPASRKLRFKMTADQLNRIDEFAYQFKVPDRMRGKFDEVEFFVADPGASSPPRRTPWNTSTPGFSKPNAGPRLGGSTPREDNNSQPPIAWPKRDDNNSFGGFADRNNSGTLPDTRRPFGDRRSEIGFGDGRAVKPFDDSDQKISDLQAQLAASQRRADQLQLDGRRFKDEAIHLAGVKSQLVNEKARLTQQLNNAARPTDGFDKNKLGPIDRPFGADRNHFQTNQSETDRQIELFKRKIEQLEKENQLVTKDFRDLQGVSETLMEKYQRDRSRRTTDETTEKVKSYLGDVGSLANTNSIGDRFASNRRFDPPLPLGTDRNPVGLNGGNGGLAANNPAAGQNGNPANNKNAAAQPTKKADPTYLFLWLLILLSVGLNFYLSILCRSLYVRYQDLGDELRDMFSATST